MANKLSVTLIDVAWGDSIFIDYLDDSENHLFALIDSNDTTYNTTSQNFVKKYIERIDPSILEKENLFEFVLLSHAHADHGQGLKSIMSRWGTKNFWYPKSINWGCLTYLLSYSNRSKKVLHHQSIDRDKIIPNLGNVEIKVLWPRYNKIDQENENNNSVVLHLKLDNVSFLLTGDAEKEVWNFISNEIPADTKFFKVPHHGSRNGSLNNNNTLAYTANIQQDTYFGISTHVRPYDHPHAEVLDLLNQVSVPPNTRVLRTDENYHLTFESDGQAIRVKYSRI